MKKGFTLIELLAVIVILAIIALIATPMILNIINDSKNESEKVSKELYLDAVIQAIAKENLNNEFNPSICTIESDGNLLCIQNSKIENLKVEVNGTRPCGGAIALNSLEVTNEAVEFTCDSPSFAKDDWLTIIANIRLGKNVYKVGEEKEIVLSGEEFNNQSFTVRIANISNDESEGCGGEDFSETACGFVVEFVDIITRHVMNTENTNIGGWKDSEMREYLNVIEGKENSGTIYKALPDELKSGIKDTKVISGHGKGDTSGEATNNNFETTDKIYLLSFHEVYEDGTSNKVSQYDTGYDKTRQLDYYRNYKEQGVTTDSDEGAIKNYQNSATYWWLRSAYSFFTNSFYLVGTFDGWSKDTASSAHGVAPAFRIG